MAILTGIDEAGYGPLLGPLVVSSVSFSVPADTLKSDMWSLLAPAVARQRKQLAGRLLITDSKKAYSKSIGIAYLRRTVLACLKALSQHPVGPVTSGRLLEALCPPQAIGRLSSYPWYKDLETEVLGGDSRDVEIASNVLKNTLTANKMELVDMSTYLFDVGYYNSMVSAVKNKSSVLFTAVCSLIKKAFESSRDLGDLQIIIDRQGGRINYRPSLARMFPEMDLRILKQDKFTSSYELCANGRTMRLYFRIKADTDFLPVSLASMTSKYVRQLLMESINRYFMNQCQKLKPTAGYWQDGQRFIRELKDNLPHADYDTGKLIRSR